MKEERKCQELLSPEGKEEKLLLPQKNLQNLINIFEKFDKKSETSGKKKFNFEISGGKQLRCAETCSNDPNWDEQNSSGHSGGNQKKTISARDY